MNKRVRLLMAALLVVVSVTAFAGPPVSMEKLRTSDGPFIDPVLLDWCGVEILVTFNMKGKVIVFDDSRTTQHINYNWTMFNPVTDKSVIESGAFTVTTPPVMELLDEDLGTLTLIFEDTISGLAFKWQQPGVGILLRDAGVITYQLTLVFDLDTSALIDEDFNILSKGPHPSSFMSEFDRAAIICGALTD